MDSCTCEQVSQFCPLCLSIVEPTSEPFTTRSAHQVLYTSVLQDEETGRVFGPHALHFEINGDNPKRAVQFHAKVFGWQIKKWDRPVDYWLIKTGEDKEPGIDGAIMQRRDEKATTYDTVSVPSVDEFLRKIVKAGGKVMQKKTTIPGIGYTVHCADTEGNVFGIMQDDSRAK